MRASRAALAVVALVSVMAVAVAGCTVAAVATPSTAGSARASLSPPTPAGSTGASLTTAPALPPTATLAAEGGDPVPGDLGTYLVGEGGSDAPWLPGRPIRVGTGETLRVGLRPAAAVEAWSVRYVPAGAIVPDGGVLLATGSDDVAFVAPPPGAWSAEVRIVLADGRGTASWFWEIHVS
jgi:hypothetical protein